jgi:hypothetical protein
MSTTIVFRHNSWDVATTAWTAASKGDKTILCYLWGPDGFGWTENATGTASITFKMPLTEFCRQVARLTKDGVADISSLV